MFRGVVLRVLEAEPFFRACWHGLPPPTASFGFRHPMPETESCLHGGRMPETETRLLGGRIPETESRLLGGRIRKLVSLLAPVCATSRGGHNYIIIIIIIVEGWKTYGSASGVECNINFIPAV